MGMNKSEKGNRDALEQWLPPWDARSIFSTLDEMYQLSSDLDHALHERLHNWQDTSGIADIFLQPQHVPALYNFRNRTMF